MILDITTKAIIPKTNKIIITSTKPNPSEPIFKDLSLLLILYQFYSLFFKVFFNFFNDFVNGMLGFDKIISSS